MPSPVEQFERRIQSAIEDIPILTPSVRLDCENAVNSTSILSTIHQVDRDGRFHTLIDGSVQLNSHGDRLLRATRRLLNTFTMQEYLTRHTDLQTEVFIQNDWRLPPSSSSELVHRFQAGAFSFISGAVYQADHSYHSMPSEDESSIPMSTVPELLGIITATTILNGQKEDDTSLMYGESLITSLASKLQSRPEFFWGTDFGTIEETSAGEFPNYPQLIRQDITLLTE